MESDNNSHGSCETFHAIESAQSVCSSAKDLRNIIPLRMGGPERSKTFTIENILKDESKTVSETKPHQIKAKLDTIVSPQNSPHLFIPHWMRMQHTTPQAHYLLGGLPGNLVQY